MASRIVELFGFTATDQTPEAKAVRAHKNCPFVGGVCTKRLRDGTISGVCSIAQANGEPVICCPNRLYADSYRILQEIADTAFGTGMPLVPGNKVKSHIKQNPNQKFVAVFGKRWGKELRLPNRKKGGSGAYFVDWILAQIDETGKLSSFVAVEVQSIDTTGNYRDAREALMNDLPDIVSGAGLNWENVNKRILPQIIYKGHVLRQEPLCAKGIFFVCPTPVYQKILERLGGRLNPIHMQPGSLTIRWYGLSKTGNDGQMRPLQFGGQLTSTVDQVALAFTAPSNLPPPRVYEQAIQAEL
jgi:Restriction endonuclease NotI